MAFKHYQGGATGSEGSSENINTLNHKHFNIKAFEGSKSEMKSSSNDGLANKALSVSFDTINNSSGSEESLRPIQAFYSQDISESSEDSTINNNSGNEEFLEAMQKTHSQNKLKNFPKELHKAILDFVVAFLAENPNDMIEYAVKHFTKIQKSRNERPSQKLKQRSKHCRISAAVTQVENSGNLRNRRMSVFAEHIDVESELFMEDADTYELKTIGKTAEQRSRLLKAIKGIFVFQNLEPEQISRILDVMYPIRVSAGDILSSKDNADNNLFYIVETGDFIVYQNHQIIEEMHNHGTIGEITLLHTVTDVPTVKATNDGLVWAMDRKSFKNILLNHLYKQQKMFDTLLSSVKMFAELNQYERLKLVEALVRKSYHAGETIVKQGDEPDGMYFIEKGKCSVYLDQMKGKGEVMVNRLTIGDYFGELALLTHDKRKASVYAETDVKVAFIDKYSFERLLGKCVDILNRGIEDYNLKDDKTKGYLAARPHRAKEGFLVQED